MSDRPPAMLFYFKDFMTDGNVLAMTTEEKGAYLLLLCQAWEQEPPATIPNDDAVLARWCGLTLQRFRTSRNCILRPFLYCLENNRYEQKRLKQEYERAVEAMKRQSNKGKSGANKRWGKNSTTDACAMPVLKPDQCLSNAQAMPDDSNRDRDNTSSYPHSSDKKEVTPLQPPGEIKPSGKRKSKPEASEEAVRISEAWFEALERWSDVHCKRTTREKYIKESAPLWDKAIQDEIIRDLKHVIDITDWIESRNGSDFTWKSVVFSPTKLLTGSKAKILTILSQMTTTAPVVKDDYNPSDEQMDIWLEDVKQVEEEQARNLEERRLAKLREANGDDDL